MLAALRDAGVLRGWRDERYAVVTGFGAVPHFAMERAAARMFGIATFAVHVNAFAGRCASRSMWIGTRSASKPIDPGMLDNLVGGGLSSGLSLSATLAKEGYEEAGLDAARMATAVPIGTLAVCRAVPEGLQVEKLFAYRLELPENVVPRNTDGEVAGFARVPVSEVAAMLRGDAPFTADAALVACAGLLGEGVLTDGEAALVSGSLAGPVADGSGDGVRAP
jgi:8-oxo-dGTP pyrophosphatase MutT (NUDIX family)